MKGTGRALAGLIILLALAGCGSSPTPALTVSCLTRRLPSGAIRARVIVSNSASSPIRGFVYGPAMPWLRHIYPVLRQVEVFVDAHGQDVTYTGYRLPPIGPKKTTRLLMRFSPPPSAQPLLVTGDRRVHVANLAAIANPKCQIAAKP